MHTAECQLDFDMVMRCENEIAGRLGLPVYGSKSGLTPQTSWQITDFVKTHRHRRAV